MTIVRAAVVQAAPVAFDRERTLENTFGAVVGSRTAAGRDDSKRYWVGHYARPDVFELKVNERAARPVTES